MFAFFKTRAFLMVVGFLLLTLFVWFAGPYFSFAGYFPLGSASARLMAIALLLIGGIGYAVWKRFRANRAGTQLMAAVVQQSRADAPSADAVRLREQFENAVATLKQKRQGSHTLYQLPWYVIIGAPGSGKTTALLNSGLHFPLEQRAGRGGVRGVGGTRNCDWWFTDEAIFLDTAGRYTTQDSDAASDSAGWTEFLALLRKYRGRRPVNGVILTISAQDLMAQNETEREAYAEAARRRLDELNRQLQIQLPVYLMVTKCDLVSGFSEYFDDLDHAGRSQVWGVTFPYEQTLKGKAAQEFPAEFDALIARLNERMFVRLEDERDVRRRPRIFGFPQQMSALRAALADFVTEVFTSMRFDRTTLLRGVYFTSGTQEGTPIDRLIGVLGRGFAMAPDAVSAPPPGRGKAYFIERLLKHVLLGESGLAGVNRRLEAQQAAAQFGAYVAMIVIAVLGLIVFTVSYNTNRAYIGDVASELDTLQEIPAGTTRASLETVLPRLDAMKRVVDKADLYRDDAPWRMGWGLFQGNALGDAARNAYSRQLDSVLLPAVAARFEQRLREVGQEEAIYEYLKGYLMLVQPQHMNKEHLQKLAGFELEAAYAHDPAAGARLSEHFGRLLMYEDQLRPLLDPDQTLIAQARTTIQRASIPQLMFRQLVLDYANDPRVVRLDVTAGVGADQVFRRKSGVSLSTPVPALFTKAVFQEITTKNAAELASHFEADRWVWGDEGPSLSLPDLSNTLGNDLAAVYEKAYIDAWQDVLDDVELVPMPTLDRTKATLNILGRADTSPLRGLLKTVDEHTYLVAPEDPAQKAQPGGIRGRISGFLEQGKKALGVQAVQRGLEVTKHFASIHRLVQGEVGASPLDRVLEQVRQIRDRVEPMGRDVGQTSPDDPQAMAAITQSANTLKRDATTLPPSVGAVVTQLSDRTAAMSRAGLRGTLENRYRQDVLRECTEVLAGRYPFSPGARDLPLVDFGHLFGHGGVFDNFFKNELEPLVDTSRRPWSWRPNAEGASVPLAQFEAAQRIREMFFLAGEKTPELRFTVTPIELDDAARRFLLEIDGQAFEHRHGPERTFAAKWPGKSEGPAAATFEAAAGGRPNIVFEGPWAWFRLIEATRIEPESEVRYLLTFTTGSHRARVRVTADRVRNPYASREFQQFRCG